MSRQTINLHAHTTSPEALVGELISGAIAEKAKKNSAYSLRAAARDIGVTAGYLSSVIHGKKKLSFDRAIQVALFLKLNEHAKNHLLRLVALSGTSNQKARAYLEKNFDPHSETTVTDFVSLEMDQFRFLSEWHHIAILDLTLLKQFKPKIPWVAKELGISQNQVELAISRLERLGLLEITPDSWVKTSVKMAIVTNYSSKAVRDFHTQMIDKAKVALEKTDQESFQKRDITGVTMAIDPCKLPEAKKRIEKFRRDMLKFLGSGECTALYQMNVQLFQLNETNHKETQEKVTIKGERNA